uniref:Uncharacterized protein n=1 Tax=Magnetospirillum gryphiswaldense TaxID=55518 RepID=Q3BKD3_9PROT|nr:hypothetical protein mgI460 [Magnetospirillum gryphiswaldense MSR-1]
MLRSAAGGSGRRVCLLPRQAGSGDLDVGRAGAVRAACSRSGEVDFRVFIHGGPGILPSGLGLRGVPAGMETARGQLGGRPDLRFGLG